MAESDEQLAELPLDGAGTILRRAREAAGLQLSDIAARTRIAERHLARIEDGNFSAMASPAYAIGFARSYARVLGLDEHAIARAVREEMDGQEPNSERYQPSTFEPGDPARVPSARLAWIAALGALAVFVAGYAIWSLAAAPSDPAEQAAPNEAASGAAGANAALVPTAGQGSVVFTSLEPGVWVKFYDAAGNQLLQKEMALGESYTVPPEANGPMIRTARPDALQISVAGRPVAKLSETQVGIKDVPVSAAALLTRSPGVVPTAAANPNSPVSRQPARRAAQVAATPPARAIVQPLPSAQASGPSAAPVPQSSTVSQ